MVAGEVLYAEMHAADAKSVAVQMVAVADFERAGLDCMLARASNWKFHSIS